MISDQMPDIRGLIIDMDGVLWRDTEPIGDLPAIFNQIHHCGLKVVLATNNATRTVDEHLMKLKGFGAELEEWQIVNSAQALGAYLQKKYPHGASVYVVGQPSLKTTLISYGMILVEEEKSDVEVVVASLDFQLTYEKLRHASLLIQSGSFFMGTNPDVALPTPEGLIPGAGTMVGALELASGKKAKIIGKPEPVLFEMALDRLGLDAPQTLAIGDRLETDISGAKAAGLYAALVLSGVTTREQLKDFYPKPDLIAQDLTELIF